MIVEDEALLAKLLHDLLLNFFSDEELRVYLVEDGLSGIKCAEKIRPDLIILDVVLPVLSGVEVYEKLENSPQLSHSKFIIISGEIKYAPSNVIFMPKPFGLDEFVKTVGNLTGLRATVNLHESKGRLQSASL